MSQQGGSSYLEYLSPILGTRIVAIEETEYSILLFLSDGSVLEFEGDPDGGVGAELHTPRARH